MLVVARLNLTIVNRLRGSKSTRAKNEEINSATLEIEEMSNGFNALCKEVDFLNIQIKGKERKEKKRHESLMLNMAMVRREEELKKKRLFKKKVIYLE